MDFTTLLSKAIESNNSEVIEFLMKDHDKVTELKEAITKKNVVVTEYLIKDEDCNLPKEVITMLTTSWPECFTLFAEEANNELLCTIATEGLVEEMKVMFSLRDLKVNLDHEDGISLRFASMNGHTEIVKMLIDECADMSATDYQCVRNAFLNNHLETMKILVDNIEESNKLKVLTSSISLFNNCLNEEMKNYVDKCIEELTTPVKIPETLENKESEKTEEVEVSTSSETQAEKVEVTVETVEVPKLVMTVEDVEVTVEEPVQEQISIAIGSNPGTSSETQLVFNVTQIEHIKTKPYFGIMSDTKLDVKFPCITEMESEDKWYYVYPLDGALLEKFNSVSVVFTQFGNKTPSFYTL